MRFMGRDRSVCVFMGRYKSLCVLMGPYMFLCAGMDSNGSSLVLISSHSFLWILMCLYVFL